MPFFVRILIAINFYLHLFHQFHFAINCNAYQSPGFDWNTVCFAVKKSTNNGDTDKSHHRKVCKAWHWPTISYTLQYRAIALTLPSSSVAAALFPAQECRAPMSHCSAVGKSSKARSRWLPRVNPLPIITVDGKYLMGDLCGQPSRGIPRHMCWVRDLQVLQAAAHSPRPGPYLE